MVKQPKTPNEELDKFLLRMPDGLRERIKREAESNNRSMNAEIVATLEEAYPLTAFDIAHFMETWMVPIIKAENEKERTALIESAILFLQSNSPGATVVIEKNEQGKAEVILDMGSVRLVVGDVKEMKST